MSDLSEKMVRLAVMVDRVIDRQQSDVNGSIDPKERAHLAGFLLGLAFEHEEDEPGLETLLRFRIVEWYRYRVGVERLLP